MKKSIFITIILSIILMAAMFTSSVNAASLKASATKVEAGKTVEVTVKTEGKVQSTNFQLSYDSSKFEYVETKTTLVGAMDNNADGAYRFSVADANEAHATDTITVVFRAKTDIKAEDNAGFTLSDYANNISETVEAGKSEVSVTVAPKGDDNKGDEDKKDEEDKKGEDKNEGNKNDSDKNKDKDTSKDKDKNEGLLQTGTPAYVAAIAAIVIAAGILAFRKLK